MLPAYVLHLLIHLLRLGGRTVQPCMTHESMKHLGATIMHQILLGAVAVNRIFHPCRSGPRIALSCLGRENSGHYIHLCGRSFSAISFYSLRPYGPATAKACTYYSASEPQNLNLWICRILIHIRRWGMRD